MKRSRLVCCLSILVLMTISNCQQRKSDQSTLNESGTESSQESVEVKTISGRTEAVSVAEIEKAFRTVRVKKSMSARDFVPNPDKSITIYAPTIDVNGDRSLTVTESTAKGACIRFGYATMISFQQHEGRSIQDIAELSETGTLLSLKNSDLPTIAVLICR